MRITYAYAAQLLFILSFPPCPPIGVSCSSHLEIQMRHPTTLCQSTSTTLTQNAHQKDGMLVPSSRSSFRILQTRRSSPSRVRSLPCFRSRLTQPLACCFFIAMTKTADTRFVQMLTIGSLLRRVIGASPASANYGNSSMLKTGRHAQLLKMSQQK